MNTLLNLFPFHLMSTCIGALAHIPLPRFLADFTVGTFARSYGIDTNASIRPFDSFTSVGDFFTRDLKPELRPIGKGLVSPVDGKLRALQRITDGTLLQVKGVAFSIADLLHSKDEASYFEGGVAWNLYLSPSDAHHIHVPHDGQVRLSRHVPGSLFPVNDWALKNIPGLFVRNERVVSLLETELGPIAVVMVGAANVGAITLSYSDIKSWRRSTPVTKVHEPAIPVKKGDKLGTFHLGSSVVLLASRAYVDKFREIADHTTMRYGETLES